MTFEQKYALEKALDQLLFEAITENDPGAKVKIIFHGGCLSCVSPETEGTRVCFNCRYREAKWRLPDKRRTYGG